MKRPSIKYSSVVLLALIAWQLTTGLVNAAQKLEMDQFEDIEDQVNQTSNTNSSNDEVLLVFDLDNTLLRMNQYLGSDKWFGWQESLDKESVKKVGSNFGDLLHAQGILFKISQMEPPEPCIPEVIERFQRKDYPLFVMTSRGKAFKSATFEDLEANDLNLTRTAIGPDGGFGGDYIPYDRQEFQSVIGKPKEHSELYSEDPRPVSYENGVYFTAGQHKGVMLKMLLDKVDESYSHVIFVDDKEGHVNELVEVYQDDVRTTVTAIRYSQTDAWEAKFNKEEKEDATQAWKNMKSTFQENLNEPQLP